MTSETLATIRRNALANIVPPPKLRLSEWIERSVFLPEGVSSLPGAVRLWPFQREIADAIGDPLVERVTLVKPVRVGFTTLLTGAMGNFCANDPAPILSLLPTEADCRDYMVSDVEPVFAASPSLASILSDESETGGRNTLLSKRFPGGSLKVVAAKAPRNLRRHNVRVLFIDEADGMDVTAEGSPILLAERRTLSFADRKIVIGSTPVFEETSHVLRAYAQSDARIYEVPCPECGEHHEIRWKDIQWPEGEPAKAHYVCPACGSVIEERHKPAMVAGGRWRATRPDVQGHAGSGIRTPWIMPTRRLQSHGVFASPETPHDDGRARSWRALHRSTDGGCACSQLPRQSKKRLGGAICLARLIQQQKFMAF